MVVRFRFAVGVTLIWVTAVAGVSATAWVVIDRAGRDVTTGDVSALVPSSGGAAAATTTSGTHPSETVPGTQPSAPTTSGGSASSATPRDRTVAVAGGQVSVRCTAAIITLRIAQPNNGWDVDVDRSGSTQVEVKFERGDGDTRVRNEVNASCAGGVPVFTVENKSD